VKFEGIVTHTPIILYMGNSQRSTENHAAVLLISRHLPDALEGDRGLRLLQYAQSLTRIGTEIDFLICPDRDLGEADVRRCRSRIDCRRLEVVRGSGSGGPGSWFRRLARALPTILARKLTSIFDMPLSWKRAARRLLRETRYHAIVVFDPGLASLCRRSSASTMHLLDLVDLGLDKNRSDGPWRQASFRETLDQLYLFDRVLAPTGLDANLWEDMGQGLPLTVLPYTGTNKSAPQQGELRRPPGILLLSSRDPEDCDAVRFFRKKVFPRIQERVPSARLRIFSPEINMLDPAPDVDLFDSPAVLEELIQESWVCVFPQRTGMRARSWLAEALCRGKAIVATPSGAYGLGLDPQNGVVVASSPRQFLEAVVKTLTDDAYREDLEHRARQWTTENLRREQTSRTLAEILALAPTSSKRHPLLDRGATTRGNAWVDESELAGSGSTAD
jgi:hypothetical protein